MYTIYKNDTNELLSSGLETQQVLYLLIWKKWKNCYIHSEKGDYFDRDYFIKLYNVRTIN